MAETSRHDPANKMTGTRFIVILLSWECDGTGDASVSTAEITGKVHRVTTIPDGTFVPDPNYDVVLNDSDGQDIAAGNLMNQLDTAPDGYIWPYPCPVGIGPGGDILTVVVSNAGAIGRKGTIRIYVE